MTNQPPIMDSTTQELARATMRELAKRTGLVVIDTADEATVERICEALDRHQYATLQHASAAVGGGEIRSWDQLSERTHRLRHDQFIDTARAVVAALEGEGPR